MMSLVNTGSINLNHPGNSDFNVVNQRLFVPASVYIESHTICSIKGSATQDSGVTLSCHLHISQSFKNMPR